MFHKTALYGAVMKENMEIVKLLLADEKTDVNILCISTFLIFIKLKYVNINYIQYLMKFKFELFYYILKFFLNTIINQFFLYNSKENF